jgi:hypothetical protein
LGQVLNTRGGKPLPVTVVFDLNYEYAARVEDEGVNKPDDKLALKAYIKDSNGRKPKEVMLVDLTTAAGPEHFSGRENPAFAVTLQPNLAYHLVLAGKVEVTGTDSCGATAAIEVRSLEIELLPRDTRE